MSHQINGFQAIIDHTKEQMLRLQLQQERIEATSDGLRGDIGRFDQKLAQQKEDILQSVQTVQGDL